MLALFGVLFIVSFSIFLFLYGFYLKGLSFLAMNRQYLLYMIVLFFIASVVFLYLFLMINQATYILEKNRYEFVQSGASVYITPDDLIYSERCPTAEYLYTNGYID